jgi:hypothetical protein
VRAELRIANVTFIILLNDQRFFLFFPLMLSLVELGVEERFSTIGRCGGRVI